MNRARSFFGPGIFTIGVNTGGGGGGGGGIGLPTPFQVLFTTAKDPVVPALNPLLPRPVIAVRSGIEALISDGNNDSQNNILPIALAPSNNCDTNDALLANS